MRRLLAVPLGIGLAGAGGLGYAAGIELHAFRLRTAEVPVLPPGSPPLRVLHISDLHMTAGQARKQEWVRGLARYEPDLVVSTGDNLAGQDAVRPTLAALGPLFDFPGLFVMGANDYYAPRAKNPLKYFDRAHVRRTGALLPWRDLRDGLEAGGWQNLTNNRGAVTVGGRRLEVAGVDDPHMSLDRYDRVAGPTSPGADLTLGLVHAPEPRVLRRFVTDGFGLLMSGHTHGGQLRVPFYGALVTNCGIDRERARGLTRFGDRPGDLPAEAAATPPAYLHVSAGLGTSPYAPVRFACPPEATMLTLTPRPVTEMKSAPATG